MSTYVAAYGAQASMFVGTETYAQRLESGLGRGTPRRLLSEFAIVKAPSGGDWVGYRDVIQVDDQPVVDRRDRLLRLLSSESVEAAQLKQIDDESARYNIGPISRNFNVPTTVLFFFGPNTIGRFTFERKGTPTIDGVATWELEFREAVRPTLVRTRSGRDVPCRGRVWVVPSDGTVVRTLVELRNFADERQVESQGGARTDATVPPTSTRSAVGGTQSVPSTAVARPSSTSNDRVESLAQIEVTYRLDQRFGAWLPRKMSELYEGPVDPRLGPGRFADTYTGRSTGVAEYSDFKRFETSAKIVAPK
jgi:hypothetical protein